MIITIHIKSLFLSSLKADFCSQGKFVETRLLIVDLNYSLWSEHDKHFLLLSSLCFSSDFSLKNKKS